ncbi:MAG: triose-phosphate isomerase [Anaerolineales bacterium]|nr:triose-phosphate isomerase [Anaerolineales bacterium]
MRRRLIAGNWKMNLGTVDEAIRFVRAIRPQLSGIEDVDIVLCPPFTVLHELSSVLHNHRIELGAQCMHWEESGAHTGEISPVMLQGLCRYVILGHSERRATRSFESDNAAIHRKVKAALDHELTPIICVGENLAQNEAGETHTFVTEQVQSAFSGLQPQQVAGCILAYEPIWAIGTGKAATPADVNALIGMTIRGAVAEKTGEESAQLIRVMYGGSVNKDNITSFITMPEVDGALVGGASLKPDFVNLIKAAESA